MMDNTVCFDVLYLNVIITQSRHMGKIAGYPNISYLFSLSTSTYKMIEENDWI